MKKYLQGILRQIFCFGLVFFLAYVPNLLSQPQFADVSEEARIEHYFTVFQGTFGGGAAVIDYNNDGWEDLFIAGGAGDDQLLENQKDGTFRNVTAKAGLRFLDNIVTQGAAAADVNKDGWPDLFIATIAIIEENNFDNTHNILLINNKDGTFSDQSKTFGLIEASFSSSVSFGDVNRDGYPDLYVCNYFEDFRGQLDQYSGPLSGNDFRPGKDHFYINEGGKRFVEASEAYGINRRGLTFQALWSDFDNDRDLDLLIANDFGNRGTPNLLYRNDYPQSKFTEIGTEMNFNYGINGMGIGAGDINMDGFFDYYVTNIQASPLFISHGSGQPFTDESLQRGSGFFAVKVEGGGRIVPVSWGVNFFDFDHDMDSDLYITNGCLNPELAPHPNLFLDNVGGEFRESGKISNTNDLSIGRGSIVFDYDHDGDLDLLVVNQRPFRNMNIGVEFLGTRLFRNDTPNQSNWLKVELEGKISESSGIGSRIEAYVGGQVLIREIYGGASHASQNTTIAHFGLAQYQTVDSITVKWAAGTSTKLENIPANQTIEVVESTESPFSKARFLAYPSLFDQEITLQFELPEFSTYSLAVYDLKGRKIETVVESSMGVSGVRTWNVPTSLSRGMYLFVLQTDSGYYVSKGIKQ